MPSPFVGLVLSKFDDPGLPSPPMNSLPPRLCPTMAREGVEGVVVEKGDWGGLPSAGGCALPAGLKEKSGRALPDLSLIPAGVEPRRAVGYDCIAVGRGFEVAGSEEVRSARIGKVKSGLGSSSMGPVLDWWRRW